MLDCARPPPRGHHPQSSKDSTLSAFAQLATLRLDCSRALISLIDGNHQYILSEATRTLSIQSDTRHGPGDALWLGSVVIPRSKGFCGLALQAALRATSDAPTSGDDIFIIEDMRNHPHCTGASFLTSGPRLRFYAGVPVRTNDGEIIGIYCIFDDKLRPGGLTKDEKDFMHDMSKTTMDHLEAVRLRSEHNRTNKLVNGLESFVDGLTSMRTSQQESDNRTDPISDDGKNQAMKDVAQEGSRDQYSNGDFSQVEEKEEETTPGLAPRKLWDIAMPPGSKPMFSRAANIIQQSGNYDGVAIFYMPSHNSQKDVPSSVHAKSDSLHDALSSTEFSDNSEMSAVGSDSEDLSANERPSPHSVCPLLSYSLAPGACVPGHAGPFPRFKQADLNRLIGPKGPKPRTFTLNRRGEVVPGDTSSSGSGPDHTTPLAVYEGPDGNSMGPRTPEFRGLNAQRQQIKSLRKLCPDALTYACLPLWDFERQRWLAYCIVWSCSTSRHLKEDGDLSYLRIFGNSMAIALSHIDAIATSRAKSTFVASMSHELRSPLHGVLSATKFLNDSHLSRFQQEMVDAISKCGNTLLDTFDHVMDFAKISSPAPRHKTSLSATSRPNLTAKEQPTRASLESTIDLSVLLEEVIDIVLMGFHVQHEFVYDEGDPDQNVNRSRKPTSTALSMASRKHVNSRGRVRIVVQLPYRRHWYVRTQPGAWRRLIQNTFGNALKYTSQGLIVVRLEAIEKDGRMLGISLQVADSGKGISKQYLDAHLFTPFSQEDGLLDGTGLGLSICKQITDSLGGTIDVSSTQGIGTNIAVQIAVSESSASSACLDTPDTVETVAERLQGRRVCVLSEHPSDAPLSAGSPHSKRPELAFATALQTTLKDWFGAKAYISATWPKEQADLIICLKPSLKYFGPTTEHTVSKQPILIVTHDALEMAVLRVDTRISRSDAVIEMVSHPLGPHKLARALEACIERHDLLTSFTGPYPHDAATGVSTASQLSMLSTPSTLPPTPRATPPPTDERRLSTQDYHEPFVLSVDDNKLNLRLLSVFIKKQSIRFKEASDGQEAVDIYLAAKRSVRCILMGK